MVGSILKITTKHTALIDKQEIHPVDSESVQCKFFIFDHVTFTQFKICCCVQNFTKIGLFFSEIWHNGDITIFKMAAVRILELFYHHTRPPTKSLLLAAAACQISCQSDTQI